MLLDHSGFVRCVVCYPMLLMEQSCMYMHVTTVLFICTEVVFGVKVRICGDLKRLKGPCLIILNHRTRFDWLFLWCFMIRMGDLNKHKIILKKQLKTIPIFG